MSRLTTQELVSSVILVPSFYGFMAWTTALLFYLMRLIEWYDSPPGAVVLYCIVSLAFATSMLFFLKAYALTRYETEFDYEAKRVKNERYIFQVSRLVLWSLHIIGFIGLAIHFSRVVDSLAGIGGLFLAIFEDSYLIRQTEVEPLGIYIGYFGWLAIPLTILSWRIEPKGMRLLMVAVVIQFLLNMLFIDRTRPTWLLFVSFVIWFPFTKHLQLRALLLRSLSVAVAGIALFFAIGYWVGKRGGWFDYYGYVKVGNDVALIYYYLTGGFAHFDSLYDSTYQFFFVPERTFYPLFKLGHMLGITNAPPPQVLEFIEAPFPTNVGTMLEPLYSDGGMLFVAFGILGASFVVDYVGLICLRAKNAFCLVFWANLCMVSLLAFFVPKQNATQVWLFGTIALLGFLATRFGHRSKDPIVGFREQHFAIVRNRK